MTEQPMDHGRISEIVAAYALGSLERGDEAERELLDHLPGCASCRALFRDLREVAADLALAAPARPVPPELERRLLSRIRGEAQPAVSPAPARRVLARATSVAAAVALVAAASLGAWSASLAGRVARAERRAALATEALAIIGDPRAVVVPLKGDRSGSLAFAFVPDGRAVVIGGGVPDPGEGRILQLWLGRRRGLSGPQAAGIIRPTSSGFVLLLLNVIQPSELGGVAVTVENGRVVRPTSEPVYTANL